MIQREAWYYEMASYEYEIDQKLILEIRHGLRDAYLKQERGKGARKALWRVFLRSPETKGKYLRKSVGKTQEEAVRAAIEAGELPSVMTHEMIPVRDSGYASGRGPKK